MRPTDLTHEFLYEWYVERDLTVREIASEIGISKQSVCRYLKRFNIPTRPQVARNAKGEHNANWRGGKRVSSRNYRLLRIPEHPNAQADGYVAEHIAVALEVAGKERLSPDECVHHVNFNKLDNRPENLYICTKAQHTVYHAKLESLTAELLAQGIVVFHPERGYELKAG